MYLPTGSLGLDMKKVFSLVSIGILVFITGCGGRDAHPIDVENSNDVNLGCEALDQNMKLIISDIKQLVPETQKTSKNAALGIVGLVTIFPWFFMDFSDAERQEIEAYRERYEHLAVLAANKKCSFPIEPIPDMNSNTIKEEKIYQEYKDTDKINQKLREEKYNDKLLRDKEKALLKRKKELMQEKIQNTHSIDDINKQLEDIKKKEDVDAVKTPADIDKLPLEDK